MRCVFCRIIDRTAEASIVIEGSRTLAFLDVHPANPGHVLVVPKQHSVGLADLDEADGQEMFRVAQRLAAALRRSGLRCDGVNLSLADGESAGQEVFHAHLHVIPRFSGDRVRLAGDRPLATREQLDIVASSLRRAVGGHAPI